MSESQERKIVYHDPETGITAEVIKRPKPSGHDVDMTKHTALPCGGLIVPIYTQEQFDAFPVLKSSKTAGVFKWCPPGDYSKIKDFGVCLIFTGFSIFAAGSQFGENVIFGSHCSFGDGCFFHDSTIIGDYSEFGKGCFLCESSSFGYGCRFAEGQNFGDYCSFNYKCEFDGPLSPNSSIKHDIPDFDFKTMTRIES